jgi:hypothetical protein
LTEYRHRYGDDGQREEGPPAVQKLGAGTSRFRAATKGTGPCYPLVTAQTMSFHLISPCEYAC